MQDYKIAAMPAAEMDRRWAATRHLLSERGLDALVAVSGEGNLDGYSRWFVDAAVAYRTAVLFSANEPMVVVHHGPMWEERKTDADDPATRGIGEIHSVAEFPSVRYTLDYEARTILRAIKSRNYKRVALVGTGNVPHAFVQHLTEALAGSVQLSDITEEIDALMIAKSDAEIATIRQCAELQDSLLNHALTIIRPGVRDIDISAQLRALAQKSGSEAGIIYAGSGPADTMVMFRRLGMENRTIQKGDAVALLIENSGPAGYYTELSRIVVLGNAPNSLLEADAATRELQREILPHFIPGASCAELFALHNQQRARLGLPAENRIFAHGQGLNLVERPLIRDDEPAELQAGSNLAIHPTISDPAKVFHMTCDNFIVRKDAAPERLHKSAQRVFEI